MDLLLPKKREKSYLLEIFPQLVEEEDKETQQAPFDYSPKDVSSFWYSSRKNT